MNNSTVVLSEPIYTLSQTLESVLLPAIQPYEEGYLQVSTLHSIWYASFGNPDGVPVVFIHGGPGIGCGPNDMRYFDPSYYRIVLFDQRGAKRSKPFGEISDNSTDDLINDLEALREHLTIAKWLVFGGSWGSALSLLYGEAYPERCLGFILRGVFLARKPDADNIWYGMRDIFPELWDKMQKFLPPDERDDVFKAYYKRFMDPDPKIHMPAARAFMEYDLKAGTLMYKPEDIEQLLADERRILGAARMFSHYYINNFFIQHNQILDNVDKIKHLPAIIVHGRYDIICRAIGAYELHQKWPGSELVFVQDAGHTTAEPGIAKSLGEAAEKMKKIMSL